MKLAQTVYTVAMSACDVSARLPFVLEVRGPAFSGRCSAKAGLLECSECSGPLQIQDEAPWGAGGAAAQGCLSAE